MQDVLGTILLSKCLVKILFFEGRGASLLKLKQVMIVMVYELYQEIKKEIS